MKSTVVLYNIIKILMIIIIVVLIDKDNMPRRDPPTLTGVMPEMIDHFSHH